MRHLRGFLPRGHDDHDDYDAEAAEMVRRTLQTVADGLVVASSPVRPLRTPATGVTTVRRPHPGHRFLVAAMAAIAVLAGGIWLAERPGRGGHSGETVVATEGTGSPNLVAPGGGTAQTPASVTAPPVPAGATRAQGTVAGLPYLLETWAQRTPAGPGRVSSTCWALTVDGAAVTASGGRSCTEDLPIERISVQSVIRVAETGDTTVFLALHVPEVRPAAPGLDIVRPDVAPDAGMAFSLIGVANHDPIEVRLQIRNSYQWDLGSAGPFSVNGPLGEVVWAGVDSRIGVAEPGRPSDPG